MKKILSLIFAFCMISSSVCADNSISCNYLTNENRLTVSAQFQGLGSHIFSVICAKIPSYVENIDVDTMLENEDSIVYYNHMITDALGSINADFTISENGTYTILVTDGTNSENTTFFRFDEEVAKEALKKLNQITNYENFKAELFSMFYANELPLDSNQYQLSDEIEEKIAKYLFDNKISEFEAFKSNFNVGAVLGELEFAKRDEIISVISENSEMLKVDASFLAKLTAKQKIFFLDKFENEVFDNLVDFAKKYVDAIVLSISSNPGNYSDIIEIIESFSECGITLGDDYKKLNDKGAVFKLLIDDSFNTIDELQNAINAAVEERVKAENAGVKGSSSSSNKTVGSVAGGSGSTIVKPPVAQNVEFTDLQDTAWAKSAIYNLRDKGVVAGYGDNTFAPNKSVSRFEFVKMLVSAFDLKVNVDLIPFADIPDGHWCKEYVASAHKLGIIKGLTSEEFGGDALITREDMSVMMCRLAELIGVDMQKPENVSVSDIDDASSYAKDAVEKCIGSGLMIGSNGNFSPKEKTTRAQCAVVIDRFTEMVGEAK